MSPFHYFTPILAQAQAQIVAPAAPAVEVPWYQEGWFSVVVAMAVVILPFLVGSWLAKRLRMNDYAWRIGLLLFSLVAGIVVCVYGWPPRLGIDLSGGVILVYEVDASKAASADLSSVVDALRKDLGESGASNVRVEADAEGKVEIELAGADPAEVSKIEQRVEDLKAGRLRQDLPNTDLVLESRPLRGGKQVLVYGVRRTGSADMDLMVSRIAKRVNPGGQKEVTVRRMGSDRVEVIIPKVEQAEVEVVKDKISTAGALEFRILANPRTPEHARYIELAKQTEGRDVTAKDENGKDELVAQWVAVDPEKAHEIISESNNVSRPNKSGGVSVLTMIDPYDVGGGELSRAYPTNDQLGGNAVGFKFNSSGAQLFGELTGRHLPDESSGLRYQLAIILDDQVKSAPSIKSRITDSGIIEGTFTPEQVQFLVDILNAGSLPAALSKVPVAEYSAARSWAKTRFGPGRCR